MPFSTMIRGFPKLIRPYSFGPINLIYMILERVYVNAYTKNCVDEWLEQWF